MKFGGWLHAGYFSWALISKGLSNLVMAWINHVTICPSMKIRPSFLGPGQSFEEARAASRNFADARGFPESTDSIALGVAGPIGRWRTDFLFDYLIFPPGIMRFAAEWQHARRGIQVGDVILQQVFLPPLGFGVGVEFAVRVSALIREERRLGFAYETLAGHVESGVSEFYFEEREGGLFFTIHTFSQPGHWTARITQHLFARPYQAWCTRRALAQVRALFLAQNLAAGVSSRP